MKNRYVIVISFLFLSNFSYSSNDITIYHAKEIVTLDEKVASANAVSVKSDRIMAIGSLDDLIERNPDASIDHQFQNDVIVPGFIEHHIHPFLSAITMNAEIISIEGWDLPNNQSIAYRDRDSYMQRLSEIEENMKSDSPLITWGFHHYFHGDLSREDLDRISKDRPILVMHRSYHEFILNTPALEYFDISQEFIESLDEEARAYADFDRGHFSEQGMISVFPKLLRYLGKPEYLLSGLQLTEDYLHQNGVTMIANPGAWLIKSIQDAKNLILGDESTPFRSFFIPSALILSEDHDVPELVEEAKKLLEWGGGKVEYLPNRIKLFADGAMYSQNMVLSEGYLDGHQGAWLMQEGLYRSAFKLFWDEGYQIHIHQNGDEALDLILDVLEENMANNPREDHRTTIVHFGISRADQMDRVKSLGAIISANPYYVTALSDLYSKKGLGPERALEMVRLGDVDRAGIRFGLHSDMPMAPGSPLVLMHAAVNRINFANEVAGPKQRVSPLAALKGVTLDAAYIMGLEDDYGSISEGKLANFTILSENPLSVNPQTIKDIEIKATIVEGKHYPID
ncbi:amidohydrolase [Gammaproteobacteria bacterium]|nr:amidohydrolase [Gammaproteobacteria bacterium]